MSRVTPAMAEHEASEWPTNAGGAEKVGPRSAALSQSVATVWQRLKVAGVLRHGRISFHGGVAGGGN